MGERAKHISCETGPLCTTVGKATAQPPVITHTHKQAHFLEHRPDHREQTFGSGNIEPILDDLSCAI